MQALRIPSTSRTVAGDATQVRLSLPCRKSPSSVQDQYGGSCGDPMPPNASDTFIILKPRETWPDLPRTM